MYQYLQLDTSMTMQDLKEDVAAGAVSYQSVVDWLETSSSRVILINADNREEALMAVSYIMGVLSGKDTGDLEEEDWMDEDEEEYLFYDDKEDAEDMEAAGWVERPDRIPIVPLDELRNYGDGCIQDGGVGAPVGIGGFIGMMNMGEKNHPPYWTNCEQQPICIDIRSKFFVNSWHENDVKSLDLFAKNQKVFLLNYSEDFFVNPAFLENDIGDNPQASDYDDFICELLLRYAPDIVQVHMDAKAREQYYELLFQDRVEEYGLKIGKDVDLQKMIRQIMVLRRKDKLELINQLVGYLATKSGAGGVLTTEIIEESEIFRRIFKQKNKAENATAKLEKTIVGQEKVKQQVRDHVNILKYVRRCKELGVPVQDYHNVFMLVGAPGTAKTTVAQLMGSIMKEENLLPNDRFICVNGAELKGKYVGHSAPKTKALFDENDIIFIDEAYSITATQNGEIDSFGQEALAQLMIELERHAQDKLVMFAGYGGSQVSDKANKMNEFINANPGLRSRISATISFASYTPEDMLAIIRRQAESMQLKIDEEADAYILEYFRERTRDVNFGNGREGRSFLENCMVAVARRTMTLPLSKQTKKKLSTITIEDVQSAIVTMKEGLMAQTRQLGNYGFLQS
jgi:AAA+ superfamily predicted ATPase